MAKRKRGFYKSDYKKLKHMPGTAVCAAKVGKRGCRAPKQSGKRYCIFHDRGKK